MDDRDQAGDNSGDRSAEIHASIVSAVVEHRLAPGTRLREERLAELFQVSRTQVRPVLQRLEHEGLVERQPRRGAVVASPSREATAQIFAARRLVEPWLVRCVCEQADRGALRRLERVVQDENKARAAGDHRGVVRLSGDFHRVLAALAGNPPLAGLMQTLTVRTCLAIVASGASTGSTCREDEHAQIVQAIADGDSRRATRLMTEHLNHIERALDKPRPPEPDSDLAALLFEAPRELEKRSNGAKASKPRDPPVRTATRPSTRPATEPSTRPPARKMLRTRS